MKINCTSPSHDDANASMEVYEDSGFCFACGYRDYDVGDAQVPKREPDDIPEKLAKIDQLPKKIIRGLELPYNDLGYFIVWPDRSFFKQRRWQGEPRYQGPRGHQPPLFIYPGDVNKPVVVVEGELNAMSLHTAIENHKFTIVSPGSASNFEKAIEFTLQFPIVYAILDRDPAGVAAGIDFKRKLLKRGKRVELICVTRDYNDVLEKEGPEAVKARFKQDLGLRQRL